MGDVALLIAHNYSLNQQTVKGKNNMSRKRNALTVFFVALAMLVSSFFMHPSAVSAGSGSGSGSSSSNKYTCTITVKASEVYRNGTNYDQFTESWQARFNIYDALTDALKAANPNHQEGGVIDFSPGDDFTCKLEFINDTDKAIKIKNSTYTIIKANNWRHLFINNEDYHKIYDHLKLSFTTKNPDYSFGLVSLDQQPGSLWIDPANPSEEPFYQANTLIDSKDFVVEPGDSYTLDYRLLFDFENGNLLQGNDLKFFIEASLYLYDAKRDIIDINVNKKWVGEAGRSAEIILRGCLLSGESGGGEYGGGSAGGYSDGGSAGGYALYDYTPPCDEYARVTLSDQNNWEHIFKNMPKYDENSGAPISYYIEEPYTYGYHTEIIGDAENGFKVINYDLIFYDPYDPTNPKPRNIVVSKIWQDKNGNEIEAPVDKIEVELYKNGQDTGMKLELNRTNGWSDGFMNLASMENFDSPMYEYTVKEVGQNGEQIKIDGKDYTVETSGTMLDGFVLTNMEGVKPKPSPNPTPNQPSNPKPKPETKYTVPNTASKN